VVSLCAYMEDLSVSFNTKDQTPDDSYSQDLRGSPFIFFDIPRKDNQVFARLLKKQDILHFFLQLVSQDSAQELLKRTISSYLGVSRIEFHFCCFWIRFVGQGVVCFHSVVFEGHTQDRQYAPRVFVDNSHKDNQVLTRLNTKEVISHFFLQLVSQDRAQELFKHNISPYLGVSWIESQFFCLFFVSLYIIVQVYWVERKRKKNISVLEEHAAEP
jgi:hypothetical protein